MPVAELGLPQADLSLTLPAGWTYSIAQRKGKTVLTVTGPLNAIVVVQVSS